MSCRWPYENMTPLARVRVDADKTRERAAYELGITTRTLARYERCENDIPMRIAERMSVLYDVPFERIRQALKATWIILTKNEGINNVEKR